MNRGDAEDSSVSEKLPADGSKKKQAADGGSTRPAIRPEDLLDFIELPQFTKRWEKLGLGDDDLSWLQALIMLDPKAGKVVQGTHGLRKLRFAPPDWNRGKSGSTRVIYVYFEGLGVALLSLVYGKNEADDISDAGKKILNAYIVGIEAELKLRRKKK